MEELREKLVAMSWNDLRHEAKKHSVKAKGKKSELIESILKTLENTIESTVTQVLLQETQQDEIRRKPTPNNKQLTEGEKLSAQAIYPVNTVEPIEKELAANPSRAIASEIVKEESQQLQQPVEPKIHVETAQDDLEARQKEQRLSEDNVGNGDGALDITYTKEEANSFLSQDISLPQVNVSFLTEDNNESSSGPNMCTKVIELEKSHYELMDTIEPPKESIKTVDSEKDVRSIESVEEAEKASEEHSRTVEATAVEAPSQETIQPVELVSQSVPCKKSMLSYTSPSPFIDKKSPKPLNRFARQHQKEFNLMPSIWDTEAKLKELHAKYNSAIPCRIKQLASPKKFVSPKKVLAGRSIKSREEDSSEKEPNQNLRGNKENIQFSPPKDPNVISFKFGSIDVDDIAKVQKAFNSAATSSTKFASRLKIPMPVISDKRDVKQRTMNTYSLGLTVRTPPRSIRLATTPAMTHRLEKLATPKGQLPDFDSNSEDECSTSTKRYTPYSGRFEYKDTTHMNDKELDKYNRSKRLHQYQKQPY